MAGAWAIGRPSDLATKAAKSFGYRVQYWQATVRLIAEHPWIGCGPGNFQDTYTAYKLPEASEEVTDPHNFLLEVWATAGTPAMLALLAMLAAFAWDVRRLKPAVADSPIFVERKLGQSPGDSGAMEPAAAGDGAMPVFAGCLAGFVLAVPLGQLAPRRRARPPRSWGCRCRPPPCWACRWPPAP